MRALNIALIATSALLLSACSIQSPKPKYVSQDISFTIPFPIEVKPDSVNNFDKRSTTFLGYSAGNNISVGGTLYQSGTTIQGTVNFVLAEDQKIYPLSKVYDCETKSKDLNSISVKKSEIENLYILPQGSYCTTIKVPLKER